MNRTTRRIGFASTFAAFAFLAACASMTPGAQTVALKGSSEVPANASTATGTGTLTIGSDRFVTGSVTVAGMTPTMAHIHQAAEGANGPVIVPMTQSGNTFTFPPTAKLTDAQYDAYKAGNLYINVHSAAFPGGEVRAQLKGQ